MAEVISADYLKRKERYERNAHRNELIVKSIALNLDVRGLMSFSSILEERL